MSTTDPVVEDTIKQKANNVDNENDGSEVEGSFTDPNRYWTASTLCPLLAGTFGPLASGFSVCALVAYWRVYIPDGQVEEHAIAIPDPQWLVAINAVSLVSAVVGNASLLLNMARRLRFSIAQPITIGGFYLASVLLIVDMAALTSSKTYRIEEPEAQPSQNHALTSAFYYAIFAAALYFIIASLMCVTVWGANRGYYEKNFRLTVSQRTLMLQTMSFITYLLLGALVFSRIEQWSYLDAVYWADTTLLTVGLGDYVPVTPTGQGLLFPFAIGGIVILGLVVGSIRTLVIERGKEKFAARITEKRRSTAVNHVDVDHQLIRIGWFAKAKFTVRPGMPHAQRRGEEFRVMREVQILAERQRRYMSLATSAIVALALWFVGAAVFQVTERNQGWSYLEALFFAYTSLLTIGYGTPYPQSNSGKPFFVIWSLLAVPSLTILISNMGDTVVKWVSDATMWLGAITVLPGEHGFRTTLKLMLARLHPTNWANGFTAPGLFGDIPKVEDDDKKTVNIPDYQKRMLDRLADRVSTHLSPAELALESPSASESNNPAKSREDLDLDHDIAFYHYVLAREVRDVMKDLSSHPPKKYSWAEWEYLLRLIGARAEDTGKRTFPGQRHADALVPRALTTRARHEDGQDSALRDAEKDGDNDHSGTSDGSRDDNDQQDLPDANGAKDGGTKDTLHMPWSWLSNESPLMASQSESEWLIERLSAALERELNRVRKGGRKKPPISYRELREHAKKMKREEGVEKNGDEGEGEGDGKDDSRN